MSVHLQATIEFRPAERERLLGALVEIKDILAGHEWRMVGCFVQRTGRLNTLLDLWEMPSMGHFDTGLQALATHPRFPAIAEAVGAAVVNETLVFSDRVELKTPQAAA